VYVWLDLLGGMWFKGQKVRVIRQYPFIGIFSENQEMLFPVFFIFIK